MVYARFRVLSQLRIALARWGGHGPGRLHRLGVRKACRLQILPGSRGSAVFDPRPWDGAAEDRRAP